MPERDDRVVIIIGAPGDECPIINGGQSADTAAERTEERGLFKVLERIASAAIGSLASRTSVQRQPFVDVHIMPTEQTLRSFENIDESTIRGEAMCFSNMQWTPYFMHGADSMLATSLLVAKLMSPGEEIESVANVRFNKNMTHDLITYATLDAEFEPPEQLSQKPAITGEFVTNQGRTVKIYAYQTGEEMDGCTPYMSNLPRFLAMNFDSYQHDESSDTYEFQLPGKIDEAQYRPLLEFLRHNELGFKVHTLMDVIALAITKIQHKPYSMAGLDAIQLPSLEEILYAKKIKMGMKQEDTKITRSGYKITPMYFELIGQEGNVIASGNYNMAYR